MSDLYKESGMMNYVQFLRDGFSLWYLHRITIEQRMQLLVNSALPLHLSNFIHQSSVLILSCSLFLKLSDCPRFSAQDLLNHTRCPINNHLNFGACSVVRWSQANVIAIDAICTTIAWHKGDGMLRLEARCMDSPGESLGWRIRLLCILVLDKLELECC